MKIKNVKKNFKKDVNRNVAFLLIVIALLLFAMGVGNTIYSIYDCTTSAYADENGNTGGVYEDYNYNYLVPIPYSFHGGDYEGIALNSALTISMRKNSIVFGCDVAIGSFADFVYEESTLRTNHKQYFRCMAFGYNYVDLDLNLHNIVIGVITNIDVTSLNPEDYSSMEISQFTIGSEDGVRLLFNTGEYIFLTFYLNAGSDEGTILYGDLITPYTSTTYYRISLAEASISSIYESIDNAYHNGVTDGKAQANAELYNQGYLDGVNTAESGSFVDLVDAVFFGAGKFLVSLLSFEILGINFAPFFFGILGVLVLIFVLRLFV